MKTIQPARFLKLALFADAAASLALALLQLALPTLLADHLLLPSALLTGTGLFLLGYAALLVLLASAQRLWAAAIQFIVLGNVGWAIAGIGLVITSTIVPGPLGIAFIAAQAGAVLLFAYLEYAGLRESIWDSSPRVAHSGA